MSIFSKLINKYPDGTAKFLAWIFTVVFICVVFVSLFLAVSAGLYYVGNFILSAFYLPEMSFVQAVAIMMVLMILKSTFTRKD